jgi:hypothetical protein
MPPKKQKGKEAKAQGVTRRMRNGFSKQFGFLHIPKTGGTSLISFGQQLVDKGHPFPVSFGHSWRIHEIRSYFPKIKLTLMLRDPLERMVSGYNSRLRQGRPSYNSMWTPAEAAVMAMLPSSRHLLDAMLSEDQFSISAVAYARKKVSHLRWNYCFYFKNPEFVRKNASLFQLVGHMRNFGQFVNRMAELCETPDALVRELYHKMHDSPEKSSSVLDHYSQEEISRLRAAMAEEYAIYDELCQLLPKEEQGEIP